MFYDSETDALVQNLIDGTLDVADLYVKEGPKLFPIRAIWDMPQDIARTFWHHATKDSEPGLPYDAKRIKVSMTTLVFNTPTADPHPNKSSLFRVDGDGITLVPPDTEYLYRPYLKKDVAFMEKMPLGVVELRYIPPSEKARQVSMLETLDDVVPPQRRSGALLFFVDDTFDNAADPNHGQVFKLNVFDFERLKRHYCDWAATASETKVQRKCELFFDREHFQVFVDENRLYFFKRTGFNDEPPYVSPSNKKRLVTKPEESSAEMKSGLSFDSVFFVNDFVDHAGKPYAVQGLNLHDAFDLQLLKKEYCAWLADADGAERLCQLYFDEDQLQLWVDGHRLYFFKQTGFGHGPKYNSPSPTARLVGPDDTFDNQFDRIFFVDDVKTNGENPKKLKGYFLTDGSSFGQLKQEYCDWLSTVSDMKSECELLFAQDHLQLWADGNRLYCFRRNDMSTPPTYVPPSVEDRQLVLGDVSQTMATRLDSLFFVDDTITNDESPLRTAGFWLPDKFDLESWKKKYCVWLAERTSELGSVCSVHFMQDQTQVYATANKLYFFLAKPFVPYHQPSDQMMLVGKGFAVPKAWLVDRKFAAFFYVDDTISNAARPRRSQGFPVDEVLDLESLKTKYCAWLLVAGDGRVQTQCHALWADGHFQLWVDGQWLFFFKASKFDLDDLLHQASEPTGKFYELDRMLETGSVVNKGSVVQPYHDFRSYRSSDVKTYVPNVWFNFLLTQHPNFCFRPSTDQFSYEIRLKGSPQYGVIAKAGDLTYHPSVEVTASQLYMTEDGYFFTLADVNPRRGTTTMTTMDSFAIGSETRYTRDYLRADPLGGVEGYNGTRTIELDPEETTVVVPSTYFMLDEKEFVADVLACRHRFIILFLGLYGFTEDGGGQSRRWGHANAIVVDTELGTLARYEPHGRTTNLYDASPLDFQLEALVNRHRDIFFGGYEPPLDFCPLRGPQYKADTKTDFMFEGVERKEAGWCAAFSSMFLHFRVANPHASTREIAAMLADGTDDKLGEDLRSYVNFMIMNAK